MASALPFSLGRERGPLGSSLLGHLSGTPHSHTENLSQMPLRHLQPLKTSFGGLRGPRKYLISIILV